MPLEEDHEDMAGSSPSAGAARGRPPRPSMEDEAGGESIASPLAANRNGQL